LQRLFSTFPTGYAGVTLVLLRLFVGAQACFCGGSCLARYDFSPPSATLAACLSLGAGLMMLVGFCTPIAGWLVAAMALAATLSWPPLQALATSSKLAGVEFVALACVLAALGPGAYSLDAHLFGRREVSIRATKSSENPWE
jgi:putative oxidoreductase